MVLVGLWAFVGMTAGYFRVASKTFGHAFADSAGDIPRLGGISRQALSR